MIKKISIKQYRKLKNIEFDFSQYINIISGANGTCKSSLLHIIGNSFQAVYRTNEFVLDGIALTNINSVNDIVNPKIESLVRGDKEFNDPAKGLNGSLFTVSEIDGKETEFRRHNSRNAGRYAVKPKYAAGSKESLTSMPIVYLGLSRLYSFGEFNRDDDIIKLRNKLPIDFYKNVADLYKNITGLGVEGVHYSRMGTVKKRADFNTDADGIDSNTISSGEDNLFIILTALYSLRYYYDNIDKRRDVESILLIDELDATLHPSYQIKLLKLFQQYSQEYKIQIFFTTHSLSLIEAGLKSEKCKVNYLIDNVTNVLAMSSPDIYKIRLNLSEQLRSDIYGGVSIPIFTEDEEARCFLEIIFDEISRADTDFVKVRPLFHMVNASMGAKNLRAIFDDSKVLRSTIRSICILDGDQHENCNNHIITLPGSLPPEKIVFSQLRTLLDIEDDFWGDDSVISLGYSKVKCRNDIIQELDRIDVEYERRKKEGVSTKGYLREENKKIFDTNKVFFEMVFRYWVKNNTTDIDDFAKKLWAMFIKVSDQHGINANDWSAPVLIEDREIDKHE
jgi:hypothetical protein